jgi:hypothetical protein
MEYNKEIFLANVLTLVSRHCNGSQKEFNSRIKYDQAITKWKRDTTPSLEIAFRICDEFHCDMGWLLTGEEPLPKQNNLRKDNDLPIIEDVDSDVYSYKVYSKDGRKDISMKLDEYISLLAELEKLDSASFFEIGGQLKALVAEKRAKEKSSNFS